MASPLAPSDLQSNHQDRRATRVVVDNAIPTDVAPNAVNSTLDTLPIL